ncbi:VOC family protein [Aurantiacibacter luteus]|uniref:Glyoxalase n=1 Tax=Aurantiacibacter luteus TaxID=1581420 RepID=A0A0G9MWF0_9SPHN|nr:VOC family protein [Aurantiacibacter luteus]KLE34894.1 glyoxalase [Aurantiacibacter luteus]
MFSHVMLGTNDLDRAKAFYDKVLGVLGAREGSINVGKGGHHRVFYMHGQNIFILTQPINDEPADCANGMTIGFACASPEQVKELHDVAVANGGQSIEDPPGLRDGGALGPLHLSYFRDLDGHKICALHRPAA